MREVDAETLLVEHLSRSGAHIVRQLALGLKRLDVLAMWSCTDGPAAYEAIEVKLTDWRRAAHQAYLSGTYTHSASIAMPRARQPVVDLEYLTVLGIGLIVFDQDGWERILGPASHPVPDALSAALEEQMGLSS